MTPRELELFVQGHEETWLRIRQVAAWVQANLMNAHGGKKKIKPENILPPSDVKKAKKNAPPEEPKQDLLGMSPEDVRRMFADRKLQRDEAAWLASPEAKRMHALQAALGYGPAEDEEASEG